MLDAKVVVEDIEALLDEHHNQLRAQGRKQLEPRVRVYDAPTPVAAPPAVAVSKQTPTRSSSTPFSEVVANLFVLLMLSVLNQGLSSQPSR